MVSTSSDWLYELRNHPIFQDEEAGKLSLSLLASSSSSLKLKSAFGGRGAEDGSARSRKRKMCLRGSDLIVAVRNKLRIMSLVDAKGDEGKGTYKTLETPTVHFEIQQMALNSTEKMLAIGGAHHVAVVVLPRAGFSKTIAPEIRCRCFAIGPFFHSSPKASRLAKIDWHPLGEGGASLMVLTEDGIMREYNVFENAEEPKQTVTFLPSTLRRSRGYSAETPQRAVSFAFGRGNDNWSSLTAFCLTNKGEVFSICPYMPKRTMLPISLIQHLVTTIETSLKAVTDDGSNPQPALEARYQQQLKYIKTLERQLKQDNKGGKRKTVPKELEDLQSSTSGPQPGEAGFTAPGVIKAPAASQGPYRIVPEPPELDDSLESEATDLIYLHFDEASFSSPNVLGIAFDNGRVDICLDLENVEGMWTTDATVRPQDVPSLFLYETIDLGISSDLASSIPSRSAALLGARLERNCPTFVQDPVYPDTLYVYHDYGVHCIVMRKWLSAIQKALLTEGDELASALKAAKMSEIGCMVSTISSIHGQPNDVVGVVIVHDVYLSYGLLVVTSSLKLIASELNFRVDKDPLIISGAPEGTGTRAKRSLPYVSLLGRTPFQLPDFFTRSDNLRYTSVKNARINDNSLEGMRAFGQQAEEIETQMSQFAAEANKVQDRLILQRKELERQLGTLVAIQKKTKEVMQNGETILRPRLVEVLAEQRKLLKRADKILQQMINGAQPTITEAESEWIEELERMEEEFNGRSSDSLQTRRDSVQWQMVALESELKRLEAQDAIMRKGNPSKNSGIGRSQLAAVDQRLNLQNNTLVELKNKLTEVEEQLDLNAQDD
ncbi:hypothetical protein CALVIDRAFT_325045 [Calocera viscosa TUFC12733]|uniref:Nucleoporin Nup82 n=1 Tax=Calocera viscosa (strain TUFC12733) TaxID=1330018 RepID=A0A167QT00_CALVF|nr:hypothetical protein CALVIDRAFT_325045 [Calocera viscosa TUFC12733]